MTVKYGFIRQGDKTSCGGTVISGDPSFNVHGRGVAPVGTPISCKHRCQITQGWPAFFDKNKLVGYHGCSTTRGCRCISTVNGVSGFGDESNEPVPDAFVPQNGEWVGVEHHGPHDQAFDEYFILTDKENGPVARNRFYRITLDSGEVIEGYTDQHGRTSLATSDKRTAVRVEVGRQREIQVGD